MLLQLAECNTLNLKLTNRLDYLSRAVVAASAILSPSAAEEQLHREIQEKVEVGAIQQLIQKSLADKQVQDKQLDDNLYDLTHLYQVNCERNYPNSFITNRFSNMPKNMTFPRSNLQSFIVLDSMMSKTSKDSGKKSLKKRYV